MFFLRFVPRLLAVVAVAVGIAGFAVPAAQASSGRIIVQFAPNGVSPGSSVGMVSVSIAATTPLTSLTVSLYSGDPGSCGGTHELDLPISSFVQPAADGGNQWGTWTLSNPITTAELSLGYYQVCVSATDQGGDSLSDAYVGPLYFFDTVEFPSFSANGTSFSFDNQDVTLSGTAQLLTPAGTTTPFAGKTLDVAGTGNNNVTAVTGSDGSFSVKFQVPMTGPYWVYYPNDGTAAGSSPVINLTLTTFPVRISAALTAKRIDQGKRDSISGTVTYEDNGVRKPLAGNTVWLCSSGDPYPCASLWSSYASGSATTDANGKFTIRVPTAGSDVWLLQTTSSLYFPSATKSLPLSVVLANAITSFKAGLSSFGVVSYSGCITSTANTAQLEYSAKPAGPWRKLKVKPVTNGYTCGQGQHIGYEFSGTAVAQLAAAYYRAIAPASSQWQATVGRTVYLWKYLTKITSFAVTPRHVAKGGHIRVSGRLWTSNGHGKWRPYGHRRILVIFKYRGTWYRYPGEPLTSKAGWFSGRFAVYASSPFFAQYDGDKAHFACSSAAEKVSYAVIGAGTARHPGFQVKIIR